MDSRFHLNTERDALFGPGTILKHPEAARPAERSTRAYPKPRHGAPILANQWFNVHVPTSIAALASMLYGARYAATSQTETIDTARHAFDCASIELTQRWDQIATAIGLADNAFLTSFMGAVGMVVALFFAAFAGIGAAIVHAFKLLMLN